MKTILILEDNEERIAAFRQAVEELAIVGGIVALSTGRRGIPEDWLKARESIKF